MSKKEVLKSLKENFKKKQEKTIECRKALETLQAERGKPESSLIAMWSYYYIGITSNMRPITEETSMESAAEDL
jgi:hypothetical protein